MPYFFIPFELEAYTNEADHKYPTNGPVYQWKKYKKLTMSQKFKLAKEYKKHYKGNGFKYFTKTFIYPMINED